MSDRDLATMLGLQSAAFRAGEQHARLPAGLRHLVGMRFPQITLTLTPEAALRPADDLELAISARLHDGGGTG